MKKLLIIIALLISISLYSGFWKVVLPTYSYFDFSAKSNEAGEIFDYSVISETQNKNISTYTEYFRKDNKLFRSHDFALYNYWKWYGVRARWQQNSVIDLQIYQLNAVLRFKGWFSGIMQLWRNEDPQTCFLLGKEFTRSFNFFLAPTFIHLRQDFMTSNFKEWFYESMVRIRLHTETGIVDNIAGAFGKKINTGHINLDIKYIAKNYGQIIWDLKFRISAEF